MGNDLATLREKTVLCRVSGSAYGMTRVDRLTKARAVQDGSLPPDATVMVPTLRDTSMKSIATGLAALHAEIVAAQYAARNALRNMSLPYGDEEGWRILPHSMMSEFLQEFTSAKATFNTAVSSLKAKLLPVMVTLGHSFEETDATPSEDLDAQVAKVTSAYTLTWRIQDYPAAAFPGLPDKTAQTLRQRHEAELGRVVAAVREQPLARLAEPVLHLVERLTTYDAAMAEGEERVGRKISLRNSMVTNIAQACNRAKAFNVYDDPEINSIIAGVEELAGLDVGALREDAIHRRDIIALARGTAARLQHTGKSPLAVFTAT